MSKFISTFFYIFFGNLGILNAQIEGTIITLWDSLPAQDLTMNIYEPDTSAEAVVLLDNGYLRIVRILSDPKCVLTCLHRVKLLKKSAFDEFGSHSIKLRNYEKLISLKAQTISPDGSRHLVKDFYTEKLNESVSVKKFAFPKLQEGSIIEYEYTIESSNLLELYPWYFQEAIPVRHSELIVNIPGILNYIYIIKGGQIIKRGLDLVKTRIPNGNKVKVFNDSLYRYTVDTIEAMKPEGYITTMNDYVANLKFQLKKINPIYGNEKPKEILSTWEALSKEFLEDKSLGYQLSHKNKYNEIWKSIKPILEKATTQEEKIRLCYDYFNKNITWIDDNFSIYIEETLEDAFKKKRANSGELNLMLIACLNEAGIKAHPMLISTRDNGLPYTSYPIRKQFNHLFCYIEDGKKSLFLDVGNIFRPMTCPRIPSLNGSGFVLDANNPRWVDIVAPLSSEAILVQCTLKEDGFLFGSFSESHEGYSAVDERSSIKDDNKNENIKKEWEHVFSDIKLDSIKIINRDSTHLPFKRLISFTLPNAAVVSNDLIYLKPTLKTDFDESRFKQKKRNYPVDMPYPILSDYTLNLILPEGFSPEELPKDIKISLENDGGSYIYTCSHKENQIQLRVRVEIKKLHFPKKSYPALKDFFDIIAAKQAEQIVLKRNVDKKK
jgi:Domain of Unknown Function with PDB structure (DUF3857)